MIDIIAQIIFCMLAAALLGFIIGWIFSSFVRNEKHQNQILSVRETFDEQKAHINQLETDLTAKDREILLLKEEYATVQKDLTARELDQTPKHNSSEISEHLQKIDLLKEENELLLTQIKEQKICEDENAMLQNELAELETQNQSLQKRIEALNEFESSYKENIHRIAELESNKQVVSENEYGSTDMTTLFGQIETLKEENNRLITQAKAQKICQDQKNVLELELQELENEKQALLDEIEEIRKKPNKKMKKTNDISSEEVQKSYQSISDTICKQRDILSQEDLQEAGLENSKLQQILKNLFIDPDKR